MAIKKPIDFYKINIDYIKELHTHDSQVYFRNSSNYSNKPYIGIIIEADSYNYFIPLTSRKQKHANLKNTGPDYALIYEYVYRKELVANDVAVLKDKSPINDDKKDIMKKILSMLDYKKAVPVPKGEFQKISIINDPNRDLLSKEYGFLLPKSDKIHEKALKIINKQKTTGRIIHNHCNFSLLENVCRNWALNKMSITALSPEITVKVNHQVDISSLVLISNGHLVKDDINTSTVGEYEYIISSETEFGDKKNVNILVKVIK